MTDPLKLALLEEGISGDVASIADSIYQQESGRGKNTKTSNAGAVGGMQIIPATFKRFADKDWDINDPVHNARAGVRYIAHLNNIAGGDPALTAAGYYGGEGAINKAKKGIAVSDPRNPKAPNTLQYGKQVADRMKQKFTSDEDAEFQAMYEAEKSQFAPDEEAEFEKMYQAEKSQAAPKQEESPSRYSLKNVPQNAGNLIAGAVRGAGSIGSLATMPFDALKAAIAGTGTTGAKSNVAERKQGMDGGLEAMGAQPNSGGYQVGKLAAEIAGTAGVGNVLALGTKAPIVANALKSGGFNLGTSGNYGLRIGAGAATGASAGAMVDPENTAMYAGLGAVAPPLVKGAGAAGKFIGNKVTGGVSEDVATLAKRASDLGIKIPADRLVNSRPMNAVSSALNYVPFSGRAATEDAMNTSLNKALSKTFGEDSSNVSKALRSAQENLGAKFDDVLKNNTVTFDKTFLSDLQKTQNMAGVELANDGLSVINKQIDEIIAKGSNGNIDGKAAYNIKKSLDRIGNSNQPQAYYARQLKKDLMSALDRSMGTTKAKEFSTLRKQYGNMLDLEGLAVNGADGEISVARLANMKNIGNKDLKELADIAATFVKPREGAHGSAQRAVVGALTFGTAGLPALATGAGIGRGTNMLLNSNALKNAMLGTSAESKLFPLLSKTSVPLISASQASQR